MGLFNGSIRSKVLATLTAIGLSTVLAAGSAGALAFDTDSELVIKVPTTSACPTLTEQPRAYEAWFNVDDMEVRGYYDPLNQVPWDFRRRSPRFFAVPARVPKSRSECSSSGPSAPCASQG